MFEKLKKWAITPCGRDLKKQKQCKIIHALINTAIIVIALVTIAVITFFWAH